MLRRGEGEEVEDSSSHRAGLLNHKRGIEAAHPSCSSTSNEILAFLLQRRIIDPASRSNELLYFRYSDEVWGVKTRRAATRATGRSTPTGTRVERVNGPGGRALNLGENEVSPGK
eukprot:scaffold113801_cov57-Phaeocystis_antarctica.AAC.2